MNSNILIDVLPQHVKINGKTYKINSDFRTSMVFEMMINDSELSNEEKTNVALDLYYTKIPCERDLAVEAIIWFYSCAKKEQEASGGNSRTRNSSRKNNRIYDYELDAEYIYSAFLDQYGIDLQDIKYLHWWKFRALFKSLKEDNQIVKIMGYRSVDITKDMSKEQKDFYKKMKKLYEIPKSKTEKEKINDIEKALLNGGDLSDIL
ncbi:bacteriophage Gp15 family protein [Clostridioides sp. ZZV14-5902]|uniref:bacteriophage Gp15 family protein n=1 Tax=Clostridioides sp. ZZV14-5902 TaxID=2811486 RepID=UPI001D0FC547|nr:bacteriophage Gp15 family protein [Clostridioides sp. ZZV14-5902]